LAHQESAILANLVFSEAWKHIPLGELTSRQAMLDAVLSSMAADAAIGTVLPGDPHVFSWTGNREEADRIAARIGFVDLPERFDFPIGTMSC
jgi:lipopolysaccharide biosynthesis protein